MDWFGIQRRLKELGLYEKDIDGDPGPATRVAISSALDLLTPTPIVLKPAVPAVATPALRRAPMVPAEWMPRAKMERAIFHWTAGSHTATEFDRAHYHVLINGDGTLVKGIPSIAANAPGGKGRRASHTLNTNTGSIGVSLCCMADAVERPFNPGKYPLTKEQWESLKHVLADLCEAYSIPVSPKTVLSHAEVQANLGIKQRNKWDVSVLPFDRETNTARECGDVMRAAVRGLLP